MSINIDMLKNLWEAVNTEGPEAMRRFHAPDYVRHGSDRDYSLDEWIALMAERQKAFPDNRSVILDTVGDGDRVAYRWSAEGTHANTYLRVPPTGKKVRAEGITFTRFQDGVIKEEWASWNKTSVLHSLGIIPIA